MDEGRGASSIASFSGCTHPLGTLSEADTIKPPNDGPQPRLVTTTVALLALLFLR